MNNKRIVKAAGLSTFAAGLALILGLSGGSGQDEAAPALYIVQAANTSSAGEYVGGVGGEVVEELGIIHAVGALLTPRQAARLRNNDAITLIFQDRGLAVSQAAPESHFPGLIGAADLHAAGVDGRGVGVAVIDTGIWQADGIDETATDVERVVAEYDLLAGPHAGTGAGGEDDDMPDLPLYLSVRFDDDDDAEYDDDDDDGEEDEDDRDDDRDDDDEHDDDNEAEDSDDDNENGNANGADADSIDDWSGHGTHVTSVIVGSRTTAAGRYQGVAPGADVVAIKTFEPDGSGRYIDVIRGIDLIVRHKDDYGIRVLNLSFSGTPVSRYWEDPLNQAVMAAWQAGIVVVAAAGNSGPDPMTVGVPGNVPYIITVGAMTDSYTPADPTDDRLASWSSAGPTHDGFVKPDIVAPGGHLLGIIPGDSWIALEHPQYFQPDGDYFTMSGTSQAAAVVSGVVALMLQADPSLSPDDVKCRLLSTARAAVDSNGAAAYSIFQQGAGLIDAMAAINSGATGCANRGMDVDLDLAGVVHYGGPAHQDSDGNFYLVDPADPNRPLDGDAYLWKRGTLWQDAYLWKRNGPWSGSPVWNHGSDWSENYHWQDTHSIETDAYLWKRSLVEPVSINRWVPQE